jgi:F-type H+-transporting ATPase subunit delta
MDIGIISTRYAKALLRYALEQHQESPVYEDIRALSQAFLQEPRLLVAMKSPVVSAQQKTALLGKAAEHAGQLSPTTARFLELVVTNGRADMAGFIAHAFLRQYCAHRHITPAQLTTAVEMPAAITEQLQRLVEHKSDSKVVFTKKVDPAIGGGFILRYDTYQIDASIRTQLEKLHQELTH